MYAVAQNAMEYTGMEWENIKKAIADHGNRILNAKDHISGFDQKNTSQHQQRNGYGKTTFKNGRNYKISH